MVSFTINLCSLFPSLCLGVDLGACVKLNTLPIYFLVQLKWVGEGAVHGANGYQCFLKVIALFVQN